MRSMRMPSRNHHTDGLLRPKKALRLAKGLPSVRMARGSPRSLIVLSNTVFHAKHHPRG